MNFQIVKRLNLPAVHSCDQLGMPIGAPIFQGYISADRLKAFATEELHGVRHGSWIVRATRLEPTVPLFQDGASRQTEPRISTELFDQSCKVCWLEDDIGIEVSDKRVLEPGELGEAKIYRIDLGSEVPCMLFLNAQKLDERILASVASHDLVCSVRRAVADENPLLGRDRLGAN